MYDDPDVLHPVRTVGPDAGAVTVEQLRVADHLDDQVRRLQLLRLEREELLGGVELRLERVPAAAVRGLRVGPLRRRPVDDRRAAPHQLAACRRTLCSTWVTAASLAPDTR